MTLNGFTIQTFTTMHQLAYKAALADLLDAQLSSITIAVTQAQAREEREMLRRLSIAHSSKEMGQQKVQLVRRHAIYDYGTFSGRKLQTGVVVVHTVSGLTSAEVETMHAKYSATFFVGFRQDTNTTAFTSMLRTAFTKVGAVTPQTFGITSVSQGSVGGGELSLLTTRSESDEFLGSESFWLAVVGGASVLLLGLVSFAGVPRIHNCRNSWLRSGADKNGTSPDKGTQQQQDHTNMVIAHSASGEQPQRGGKESPAAAQLRAERIEELSNRLQRLQQLEGLEYKGGVWEAQQGNGVAGSVSQTSGRTSQRSANLGALATGFGHLGQENQFQFDSPIQHAALEARMHALTAQHELQNARGRIAELKLSDRIAELKLSDRIADHWSSNSDRAHQISGPALDTLAFLGVCGADGATSQPLVKLARAASSAHQAAHITQF
jgi:hypothetical protein